MKFRECGLIKFVFAQYHYIYPLNQRTETDINMTLRLISRDCKSLNIISSNDHIDIWVSAMFITLTSWKHGSLFQWYNITRQDFYYFSNPYVIHSRQPISEGLIREPSIYRLLIKSLCRSWFSQLECWWVVLFWKKTEETIFKFKSLRYFINYRNHNWIREHLHFNTKPDLVNFLD